VTFYVYVVEWSLRWVVTGEAWSGRGGIFYEKTLGLFLMKNHLVLPDNIPRD
jgi:hypothetical protein